MAVGWIAKAAFGVSAFPQRQKLQVWVGLVVTAEAVTYRFLVVPRIRRGAEELKPAPFTGEVYAFR
jgi:hypothetical protein